MILSLIEKFSGIIAILVAWSVLVIPVIKFGINNNSDTITTTTIKSNLMKSLVSFGLIVGTIFQTLFLLYLLKRFSLSLFGIGPILYLSASLATICVVFFTFSKHPTIHEIFTRFYFFVCPLSIFFIGISIKNNNCYPLLVSVFISVLYFVVQFFLLKKYKDYNALMEFWAFAMLSVWTLIVTFI